MILKTKISQGKPLTKVLVFTLTCTKYKVEMTRIAMERNVLTAFFNVNPSFKLMAVVFYRPQLDLLGHSVYDFVHPCDQEELRDLLTIRPGKINQSIFI